MLSCLKQGCASGPLLLITVRPGLHVGKVVWFGSQTWPHRGRRENEIKMQLHQSGKRWKETNITQRVGTWEIRTRSTQNAVYYPIQKTELRPLQDLVCDNTKACFLDIEIVKSENDFWCIATEATKIRDKLTIWWLCFSIIHSKSLWASMVLVCPNYFPNLFHHPTHPGYLSKSQARQVGSMSQTK